MADHHFAAGAGWPAGSLADDSVDLKSILRSQLNYE